MAAEYKTFPVELEQPRKPAVEHREDYAPEAWLKRVADSVDRAIEARRREGWHLRGSPWVLKEQVFLTMWRED